MSIMSDAQHQAIDSLLPAYALGALDPADAGKVAEHVADCAVCQAELARWVGVVAELAQAAPPVEPPPSLQARLSALTASSADASNAPALSRSDTRRLRRRRPTWLRAPRLGYALAGFAIVLLVIVVAVLQWGGGATAEIPLYGEDGVASGALVVAADARRGTLTVTGMPPLPADRQFQLWLIDDGERADGGVFSADAAGAATHAIRAGQPLTAYDAFGVTIEPRGGSPGPTGPRVLRSQP